MCRLSNIFLMTSLWIDCLAQNSSFRCWDEMHGPRTPVYELERMIHKKISSESKIKKYSRPVLQVQDVAMVALDVELAQIVELNEKKEILVTRLWVLMEWNEPDIAWDPWECKNITSVRMEPKRLWTPDITLYNTAEGNFNIPLINPVTIHHNGTVVWNGPVLFRSSCRIDISWFPFDVQNCSLKLGSWTYTTNQLDLIMKHQHEKDSDLGAVGMKRYWKSAEWKPEKTFGVKNSRMYWTTGDERYSDITYYFILRRLPLYYVINVIVPCFEILAITTMVFLLPVASKERLTLCVSILVMLILFFILIIDFVPSTSNVIPFLGMFILLTMIFVVLSIFTSILTVSIIYKKPSRRVPQCIRRFFLLKLPRSDGASDAANEKDEECTRAPSRGHFHRRLGGDYNEEEHSCFEQVILKMKRKLNKKFKEDVDDDAISEGIASLVYISESIRRHRVEEFVQEEWRYLSHVIDRLLLIGYIFLNAIMLILLLMT